MCHIFYNRFMCIINTYFYQHKVGEWHTKTLAHSYQVSAAQPYLIQPSAEGEKTDQNTAHRVKVV